MTGLTVSGNSLYFLTTESTGSASPPSISGRATARRVEPPSSRRFRTVTVRSGYLTDVNGKVFFTIGGSSNTAYQRHVPTLVERRHRRGYDRSHRSERAHAQRSGGGKQAGLYRHLTPTGAVQSLWVSDGTAAGTVQLQDSSASGGNPVGYGGNISSLTPIGGTLYFMATSVTPTAATGSQLWATNGTAAGTVPLTTANTGSGGVDPSDLVDMGGKLYFLGNDPATGQEALWSSDGTVSGTNVIADLGGGSSSYPGGGYSPYPGGGYSPYPGGGYPSNDQLLPRTIRLFVIGGLAPPSSNAPELWESDGTAAGTSDAGSLPQSPHPT